MLCYCKREISEGDRRLNVHLDVAWGDNDEREDQGKDYVFHSFACVGLWAADRAESHDDRVVSSPEESLEPASPVVDDQTDTMIRGGAR